MYVHCMYVQTKERKAYISLIQTYSWSTSCHILYRYNNGGEERDRGMGEVCQ